jgi:putative ABC transport system permease protein
VEVALVVLIVGLTSGLLTETAKRIEGIGADIMLQPPAASIFLGFSGSPMPIKIGDKLAELKYVQAVAPALLQFNSTGGVDVIYGIDRDSFRTVSGGFVFLEGHDMEGPDDLLVDDWAAKAKHIKVGDTYNLLNHDWHVAAIIEHGKGARLFVPLATLQDLVGAHDKASIFLIKCTRPEHTEDVMDQIRHVLPGYTVRPLKDFLSLMTSTNIPGLQTFINAMIALAISIGLLVIFLTMYTTVIERTRDIGVLKSLGADQSFIIRTLLTESAALCVFGILAGVGLSYAVRAAFLAGFPTLSILITPGWILRAAGIALAGAIFGASYPAWMASRKDAVEALSYD